MPRKRFLIQSLAASSVMLAAQAQATATYVFDSPVMTVDASFQLSFAVPSLLADGNYGLAQLPGFSYTVTDGYSSDASVADIQDFNIGVSNGRIVSYEFRVAVPNSAPDYNLEAGTSFQSSNGPYGYTALSDAYDPYLAGVTVSGYYYPNVFGPAGTWSSPVDEPVPALLVLAAVGMGAVARRWNPAGPPATKARPC